MLLGRGRLKNSKIPIYRKTILLLLVVGIFSQVPVIFAQEADAQAIEDPACMPDTTTPVFTFSEEAPGVGQIAGPSAWSVIRMILVLALVAAAIYGIVFLFKKASKQAPTNDPFLKILANTHLGGNRFAHVIAVGSKAWLVGSGEGGVRLISEIQDKEIIDAMLLEESRKAESSQGRFPDFMTIMRRFGVRTQTRLPGADDIRSRRERLKGL